MSDLSAKFASAIFVSVLAGLPLATLPIKPAQAATDNCLSEPTGETPQGKHWHYHIERSTGRHCWYLRGEDELPRVAAPETAPATTPPVRRAETPTVTSIANAHAEWPADNVTAAPAPAPSFPAPDATGTVPTDNTARSQVMTRWPAPSDALASSNPPPETTAATTEEQTDPIAAPSPVPPPPPVLQPATPPERDIGSIQKLLLVAFGALALAGLTGSAVYRLAGVRRRARMRRERWPKKTAAPKLAEDTPVPPWVEPAFDMTELPADFSHASEAVDGPNDGVEPIEDFLARLTRQLQTEMESSAQARAETADESARAISPAGAATRARMSSSRSGVRA